ncbi:LPS-assembly protein LptD [Loktanella sp. S4079]|uniref:LPS-assembly protein LptD n=1 Tax=Loktanella sp. S4079 TaxID=579483 RepID=UPI0005FA88A4|nr:LPS assembly protein LptD [Loktanella sp. S4079]KJZ20256.1 organic solvent tolerance protein [Loktanella sp. S4079]
MRLLVILFCLLLPRVATAQSAATLVADQVRVTDQEQLIATGNIEVLYGSTRLTAQQITYDRTRDQLDIQGPIVIKLEDGTIVMARAGQIDPKLENGILQGARIVLDQQLQLAANQIDRREGRYSQLYKTVASSCQICGNRAPLWSIRAEKVIHDSVELQLYFENATLQILDMPVFWLPRMRLPDPNLDRATGFLVPEQRNTSQLGTGIKTPYFVTLGNHRDITLTPYVSPETRTLEIIYRQAFRHGDLRIVGASSNDTLEDEKRSYVFASGTFELSDDYRLTFDVEAVSDPAYLLDYGYSDKDRLDSAIALVRVTDTTLTQGRLTYYQTLREDESNASLPPIIADASYEARLFPKLGGTITVGNSIDTAYRYSTTDGDQGRDVTRIGAFGRWENYWLLSQGILLNVAGQLRTDVYHIVEDSRFPTNDTRFSPSVQTTLRWPLAAHGASGSTHIIEPVVSLAWSDSYGATVPNEDSTRSELDPGNIFDVSRFSGDDAIETGRQAAAGVTYTRLGYSGVDTTLSLGRVFHETDQLEYTKSSGLDGAQSDWLFGIQAQAPSGFLFDARALFDEKGRITVTDSRIAWNNADIDLSAAYIWQARDTEEGRTGTVSEWTLDAGFQLNESWSLDLDGRYDVAADRPVRAGIGLGWKNECVNINVSASRRYTSSSTVAPTTTYGISGSLTGFSTGRSATGPAAGCRK